MQSLPDSDAGVMGHTAGHNSLGAFNDALILRRFSDAGTGCEHAHTHIHSTHGLLFTDCVEAN